LDKFGANPFHDFPIGAVPLQLFRKAFDRDLRPGRIAVAAGGPRRLKSPVYQQADMFARVPVPENDGQAVGAEPAYHHGLNLVDADEQVGDHDQDVAFRDMVEMDESFSSFYPDPVQGQAELAEVFQGHFNLVNAAEEVVVSRGQESAEGDGVKPVEAPGEIVGISFNPVAQRGGQGPGNFDLVRSQVLVKYGTGGAEVGADICEFIRVFDLHRVVVNADIHFLVG